MSGKKIPYDEVRSLILTITLAEQTAARLGMWRTMHALNAAKRKAGWDAAMIFDSKNRRVHERAERISERGRA